MNPPEPANLKSLLRARQQVRHRKSCLPCRERKVKCDRNHPCMTCSRRGHPDLCQYLDASQRASTQTGRRDSPQSPAGSAHDENAMNSSSPHGVENQDSTLMDAILRESPSEMPTHSSVLGARSILAITRPNSVEPQQSPDRRKAFEKGILPLLGIDADAPSSAAETPDELSDEHSVNSLPGDEELIKLFEFYRDRVYPFQFMMFDLAKIERAICSILTSHTMSSDCTQNKPLMPAGDHFIGLLHAILACGAQFSDLPSERRLSLSHKHAKRAFEALRVADYLLKPCKETLETLLILGNVLQNDMNPQAAWILGGTTIRLGISLGIQNHYTRQRNNISSEEAKNLRQAIVWQDALLSLAFDRPPSSYEMDLESDLPPLLSPERGDEAPLLNYREAMNWLCHFMIRYSSRNMKTPLTTQFTQLFKDIELLRHCQASHLQDRLNCGSIREIEEYYSFELHKNFAISTLCRPIASKKTDLAVSEVEAVQIMKVFQESLKKSAWAFIRLHSITSYARRSWAFIHNGLTSALLLSFMADTRNADETRDIQNQLIRCLVEGESNLTGSRQWGGSTQLSNPHQKCLIALQSLSEPPGDERHASRAVVTEPAPTLSNEQSEPQIQGNFDIDDWLRAPDLDNYSPLDALDLIMLDREPFEWNFNNDIAE